MCSAARHPVSVTSTDLTASEMDDLTVWGQAHRLEVVIEAAGDDIAVDVAHVGYGYGLASWTIHRGNGHVWLARIGDQSGQPCEGWLGAVGSMSAAMDRIIAQAGP